MKHCLQIFGLLTLFCLSLLSLAAAAETPAECPVMLNGSKLPMVFKADFSKDAKAWTATDPDAWKLTKQDGNPIYSLFKQSDYKPPVRCPHNQSYIKDLVVGDFVLEAELQSTGRQYGHRDMCLFFGKQDESHLYYTHISPSAKEGDPHAHSIFIVNDAPRKSIADYRIKNAKWGDDFHKVRLVRNTKSGDILVYFDNMKKPIMKANDKTFLKGMVGVGSFDDTGNVRSFVVWGKKSE